MTKKTEPTSTRTLLLKHVDDKESRIVIPGDSKLTFGPATPYAPKNASGFAMSSERGYALRIYRGSKENLIAVFTGVLEFRDLDIKRDVVVLRTDSSTVYKSDEDGYTVKEEVKRERALIPDSFELALTGKPRAR